MTTLNCVHTLQKFPNKENSKNKQSSNGRTSIARKTITHPKKLGIAEKAECLTRIMIIY